MFNYHKPSIPFGVIGLGRFGYALAETLAASGKEVLVLDNNENKIRQIQEHVGQAFVTPILDKPTLEEAGIQNCETVVVCIGEQIEASILTALNVIELGVPRVIAKAISAEHGKVLRKIGAEVVYPEKDMAVRLAGKLSTTRALDYIELNGDFSISEIKLTDKFDGITVMQANLRKNFGINIIAIIKGSKTTVDITPDIVLNENDVVVVVGRNESIAGFEDALSN
ncbi:TrkA family potassium uptake protein [Hydrogenoanaerobacterium sp.]|uniref:potassium channel family protein n=1 Tax=Hydrogenoanaerobacterium sp. TaxID=2953763 RepID=UPI00289FE175|nr:TrkA family potassium uptake protein [Hydrogenoanaerobacterium sp.]